MARPAHVPTQRTRLPPPARPLREVVRVEGVALPLSTRLLVGTSNVFVTGWPVLLLLIGATVLGARSWLAQPDNVRTLHARRLSVRMIGDLELKLATARFTRALALLLANGRALLPSLRIARAAVTNSALSQKIEIATEAVAHGAPLHHALADTLPPLATELIAVGEESGRLDEMCTQIATSYDSDVKRTLHTLIAIVEPVLILVFGLIVGFVAFAMLQAIYSVNATIL
jgi:type II secretory pathway component PulF